MDEKKNRSLLRALKRMWDRGGEKKAAKQAKKQAQKAPGTRPREIGRVLFWVLLGSIVLLSLVTFLGQRGEAPKASEGQKIESNKTTSPESVAYATDFLTNYFTYTASDEGWKNRAERLSFFLAKGLDTQAGLVIDKIQTNSSVKRVEVKDVQETGKQQAFITLKVQADMSRVWTVMKDVEVQVGAKKVKKKVPEQKKEAKVLTQYIVVPVAYKDGGFGIYDLPKVTNIARQTTLEAEKKASQYGTYDDSADDIHAFLMTFFQSYASDEPDKLAYLVKPGVPIAGLQGLMAFKEITSTEVRKGDNQAIYVWVTVTFQDPGTGVILGTNYQLTLEKGSKGARFVVTGMNEL